VIYDPADPDYIGVYIGSSFRIGPRIKEHIEDLNAAKKHKKKRHLNTIHIDFWSRRPGIRDFWLVFGQLETRDDDDKEELAFFSSERYLFKSYGETCRKALQ
jgi:Uri superfamily endonuclease